MTAAKSKTQGRPSKYTEAIAAEICERIGSGETLQAICRDERMPDVRTVNRWVSGEVKEVSEAFSSDFARARARGFDAIAAEVLEIADDGRNDWMGRNGKDDAGWQFNGENVQRSKLRIWSRLQLLAKWDPKRYGERTVFAGDPEAPLLSRPISLDCLTNEEKRIIAKIKIPN